MADILRSDPRGVTLRPIVRLALRVWYNGTDLASMLPRATLYRYRREILDETGIDVLLPRAAQGPGASAALICLEAG